MTTRKPIQVDRFEKPKVDPISAYELLPSDWIGSMQDAVQILGDIVSPASEEKDWEVLCE